MLSERIGGPGGFMPFQIGVRCRWQPSDPAISRQIVD